MSVPGSDLLSEIENDNPKLGILLRRYVWPAIQSRGRAGHVLATPPDAVGDVQLTPLDSLAAANNPKSAAYVGTNAAGAIVVAPTPGAGTVTAVTGTAPIGSTGGPTPDITVAKATVGGVGVVKPDGSTITIATDGTISSVPVATGVTSVSGATSGGFAVSVTSPTTTPVVSVATDGTHYLPTATDQTNWNAKQAAGNYITALTGDVTASGPGSSSATLASTAVTPGAYTNANITVDAKGRLTAAANGTAATGTVTTTGTPASGNLTKFSGATSVTNGDLTGDVTTSGTLATSVVKVNGAAVPTSQTYVGTNSSGQIIAASTPSVPIATSTTVGTVKPDNATITVDGTGKLSVQSTATVNYVQSNYAFAAWGVSPVAATCAYSSNNTAGNCLVVLVKAAPGFNNVSLSGITDSLGNSYVTYNQDTTQTGTFLFVAKNCAAGANTVTVNVAGTGGAWIESTTMVVMEYSGVDTVSPVDGTPAYNITASGGTTLTSFPITTTNTTDILVAFFGEEQASGLTCSPTGSLTFTQRQAAVPPGSGTLTWMFRAFDTALTSAGTYSAGCNFTPAGSAMFGSMIALKAKVTVGTGSVTSVSASVPSRQTVAVTNPTTTPAIAITDNTQSANLVFAGPSSGSAAAPTFRTLVSADLPSVLSNPMTTTGDIIVGGTSGAPTRLAAGTSAYVLTSNGAGVAPSWQAGGGGGGGFGNGEAAMTVPGSGTFTQLNFGSGITSSGTNANGVYLLDNGTGPTDCVRALMQTITTPTSAWTATARLRSSCFFPNFLTLGIVMYDSVGGKAIIYGFSNPVGPLGLVNMSGLNTWSSQTSLGGNWIGNADSWLRVKFDGVSTLNYYWSRDGNFWWFVGSAGVTAFLANKPNQVGIGMNPDNQGGKASSTNPYNIQCFSWAVTQP